MTVVMRRQCAWQHAGREVVLSIRQVYDVPDAVAAALIHAGDAETVVIEATRFAAVTAPPETGHVRKRRPRVP